MALSKEKQIIILTLYFPLNILMIEILAHLSFLKGFSLLLKIPFFFLLNTILFAIITLFLLAVLRKYKLVFSIMPVFSAIIGIGTKLKIDFRGVGLNILDYRRICIIPPVIMSKFKNAQLSSLFSTLEYLGRFVPCLFAYQVIIFGNNKHVK